MATVGQIYYNVLDYGTSNLPLSSGVDIFDDKSAKGIVGSVPGANYFIKIGIQARPGTIVVINDKTIMIGASGIYELDDDIKIERMYFKRPIKYQRDLAASNEAIIEGAKAIQRAVDRENNDLKVLGSAPNPSTAPIETVKQYWSGFSDVQTDFQASYNIALAQFNRGKNGIYTLPHPENPDHPDNFDDLYNVIIDFIYE